MDAQAFAAVGADLGHDLQRAKEFGFVLRFLAEVFGDGVAGGRGGREGRDVEAGLGESDEELGHLGALKDLVDRDAFLGGEGFLFYGRRRRGRSASELAAYVGVGCGGLDLVGEVGVELVGVEKLGAAVFVAEKLVGLLIAFADAGDVAWKRARGRVLRIEILGERRAVAGDAAAEFLKEGEVFDDLLDLGRGENVAVGEAREHDVFGAELEENAVQLIVVVDVLFAFLALDFVEGRLGDVDVAALDQALHLAVEKREEKRADVGAVHVGIRHDDDLVVAGFGGIEAADGFVALADTGAAGGDEGADFLVGQNLVEAGLLGVDEFAAEREDRLETAVAALLGGAAGGVALDDVELGEGGIAFGAVGEFAGEAAAVEGAFADGLAGLAGGFAGAGAVKGLIDDLFGDREVGLEILHEALVGDGADDALNLGGEEFDLGLGFELGVAVFDRDDGGETFAHVVAGDLGVFVFKKIVGLGELVDGAGEGAAEPGEMRAAVGIVNGVGVTHHLVVVGVVVLEHDFAVDLGGFVVELELGFLDEADGFGVERGLTLVDLLHEFLDAVFIEVALGLGLGGAFVGEDDFEAGVEEGQFAEALADAGGDENGGFLEDFGVGLEADVGAGAAGFADDLEFFHGLAALELHVVDGAAAGNLDLEPLGDGVDALGADAVGAAGEFIAALAVFAAGVEGGEDHLDAGDFVGGVDVDRDAAAVVADADGAVDVDVDLDAGAEVGEMFVDGVVEDFGNAVVEGPLVGAADIHAGLLADGFEALEFAELGGVVGVGAGLVDDVAFGVGLVGHEKVYSDGKIKGKFSRNPNGDARVFLTKIGPENGVSLRLKRSFRLTGVGTPARTSIHAQPLDRNAAHSPGSRLEKARFGGANQGGPQGHRGRGAEDRG